MTADPDGPPDVVWVLQSRWPTHPGWSGVDDYYRLGEAEAAKADHVARNPQVHYRLIEATTTYRVLADRPAPSA